MYSTTNDDTKELMAMHRGMNPWNALILDSGASSGLVGRKDVFVDSTCESIAGQTANGIRGSRLKPIGRSTVQVEYLITEGTRWLSIPNVQYSASAGTKFTISE